MELYEYARDSVRDLFEAQIGVFRLLEVVEEHQVRVEKAGHDLEPILLEKGTDPATAEQIGLRVAQTALLVRRRPVDDNARDLVARVGVMLASTGALESPNFEDALGGITLRRNLAARARESLLVTLWSDFEAFLGEILRKLAEIKPLPLIAEGHKVSLDEIAKYNTLEELTVAIAHRKVASTLHDTIDQAIEVFCDKYRLHDQPLTDHLRESYLRRNTVVHAGAIANSVYLDSIAKLGVPKPEHGERLTVDRDYLTRTADELALVAFSLAVSASVTIGTAPQRDVERAFVNLPYFLLIADRPGAVRRIGEHFVKKGFATQSYREIMRVNLMIACRDLSDEIALGHMLDEWDDGALDDSFALARLCLERKHELAFELARSLIRRGILDDRHWLTWPLFREVRAYKYSLDKANAPAEVDTEPTEQDTEAVSSTPVEQTKEP